MFNDALNVREGNERRKRALAQLAAKLMQNAGRSGGMARMSGAGGGVARQNAARNRPLAQRNMGIFARLAPGGNPGLGNAIGRFGLVERMPGANDPGAVPGLGGINALDPQQAVGGGDGAYAPDPGIPSWQAGGSGGETLPQPGSGVQQVTNEAHPDYGAEFNNGLLTYDSAPAAGGVNQQGAYVNWQGVQIPIGVYKALMATGELY